MAIFIKPWEIKVEMLKYLMAVHMFFLKYISLEKEHSNTSEMLIRQTSLKLGVIPKSATLCRMLAIFLISSTLFSNTVLQDGILQVIKAAKRITEHSQ